MYFNQFNHFKQSPFSFSRILIGWLSGSFVFWVVKLNICSSWVSTFEKHSFASVLNSNFDRDVDKIEAYRQNWGWGHWGHFVSELRGWCTRPERPAQTDKYTSAEQSRQTWSKLQGLCEPSKIKHLNRGQSSVADGWRIPKWQSTPSARCISWTEWLPAESAGIRTKKSTVGCWETVWRCRPAPLPFPGTPSRRWQPRTSSTGSCTSWTAAELPWFVCRSSSAFSAQSTL